MSTFRIATRDELWLDGSLAESRLSHGQATEDELGIIATDSRDATLVEIAEREIARLRQAMPLDARVRLVAEASTDGVSATMTIRRGGVAIVTDAEHVADDDARLHVILSEAKDPPGSGDDRSAGRESFGGRGSSVGKGSSVGRGSFAVFAAQDDSGGAGARRPILWKNGTAAVLLHEAFGHPAEHGQPPVEWPAWLSVDLGLKQRRASFRDIPLTRMSHVVVTQKDAPFALPDDYIEVQLVAGGAYDLLTEVVTLQIAVPRFELRATRREIARSLAGATGDPIRYPGVICSREGQELVVPSYAPVMLTR